MEDDLRRWYATCKDVRSVAAELGVTLRALYIKANQMGLKRGFKIAWVKFKPRGYTLEQVELVGKLYPTTSNPIISAMSGVPRERIVRWASRFGWQKSEEYYLANKAFSLERKRRRNRKWAMKNRDKQREYERRYRERKRQQRKQDNE